MKAVTFCVLCGASAPADADHCPTCNAPLSKKGRKPPARPRLDLPSPLVVLCWVAVIMVFAAFVVYLVLG